MEFLADLEKKVDTLIANLDQLRQENAKLKGDIEQKGREIVKIEDENRTLKNQVSSISSSTQEQQEKLKAATEKIKQLIVKIDAA